MASFERTVWLAAILTVLSGTLCAASLTGQTVVQTRFRTEQSTGGRETFEGWLSASGVPSSADELIERMARAARVIFAGEVIAVRLPTGFAGSAEDASGGIVEIDFRVDTALMGPTIGSVYTLREWSGLWTGNARRYRLGQRLLVFLRAPDGHGLSSPVHGAEGAVPLYGGGVAPGPDDASVGVVVGWNVDLRWIQAQVQRAPKWLSTAERDPGDPRGPEPDRGAGPDDEANHGIMSPERVLSRRLQPSVPRMPAAPAPTEPLSRVLELCQQAMQQETSSQQMRPRDGSR